jgi:hypothetical protein
VATDGEGSVTQWVNDLKAGAEAKSARLLRHRDFERLTPLALARLRAIARGPADGEDAEGSP